MKKVTILGVLGLAVAITGAVRAEQATTKVASKAAKPGLRVVAGAKALSKAEKASVDGMCGCETPDKPGYGFGTTGHYGPPGQGFTPADHWQDHAEEGGDGLTPTGRALPPRAFQ